MGKPQSHFAALQVRPASRDYRRESSTNIPPARTALYCRRDMSAALGCSTPSAILIFRRVSLSS
jgi:hypothetical protein